MNNALYLLLGVFLGVNAVYLFKLVAMVLQRCGGLRCFPIPFKSSGI